MLLLSCVYPSKSSWRFSPGRWCEDTSAWQVPTCLSSLCWPTWTPDLLVHGRFIYLQVDVFPPPTFHCLLSNSLCSNAGLLLTGLRNGLCSGPAKLSLFDFLNKEDSSSVIRLHEPNYEWNWRGLFLNRDCVFGSGVLMGDIKPHLKICSLPLRRLMFKHIDVCTLQMCSYLAKIVVSLPSTQPVRWVGLLTAGAKSIFAMPTLWDKVFFSLLALGYWWE